jgi:RHS repeat-associated protein
MTFGTTVDCLYPDQWGAPHIITDADGNRRWFWNPLAFGDNPPDEDPNSLGAFTCNLRFPGQFYDADTGLNYNYFRDYNPALGRYIQPDPIGQLAGTDIYGYAAANPLTNSDFTGQNPLVLGLVAGAIVALTPDIRQGLVGAAIIAGGEFAIAGRLISGGLSQSPNFKPVAENPQNAANAPRLHQQLQCESGNNGLANPFRNKTSTEIDTMFRAKGFSPRGPDPLSGKGGYVNPVTGRSYHLDPQNSFGEPPHVDVNRLPNYIGDLLKRKYPMGE